MNPKINILLVDDEPRNLDVLETVLHSAEYNLVRATTADQALMSLLQDEYAAMVLDVQMPDMSGFELATLIKQRRRTQHIPILFLTAYFQEDKDVIQGYETGAVDYITKPVSPQVLRSKIAVFVDLFQKTRALANVNQTLKGEIARRQAAEEALQRANDELEERVEARTSELTRVNGELLEEKQNAATARDQAQAALRAKDEFLARLSHELRTPLSPVLLIATEAASSPDVPDEIRADFAKIAENVALEARLIDDLLDLTRATRGKITLDLHPVDIHGVIGDVVEMVRTDIEQKRIRLRLDLSAAQHWVVGDDVRLRQIVWNVLRNSVKFTPLEGEITVVTAGSENGRCLVRVTDTGVGMDTDELSRVFEAFWQGTQPSQPASAQREGLGLGLTISRMLVELHHGVIGATSEGKGRGSTFTIELPVASREELRRERVRQSRSSISTPEPVGETRRRVLIVEDHAPTSNALAALLSRRNWDVVVAGSLAEARSAADRGSFDILISDIGLPDGNGCDLVLELGKDAGVVCIALTGYGAEEDVKRCEAAGFAMHLTKPVRAQELNRAIDTALLIER